MYSVFPGDTMLFHGKVDKLEGRSRLWLELSVSLMVGEKITTKCTAQVAVPTSVDDNPVKRRRDRWRQ